MNPHYTYFLILGASLAGPLLLSFDQKVAFYKQWKHLFPAMLFPALFFIVWDVFKTKSGVWSFNDEYIIGSRFFSLPLEEILFFFVVPYCCVFIYACMRAYFPSIAGRNWGKPFLWFLVLLFVISAVLNTERSYTFYTSLFNVLFIALVLLLPKWFRGFDASSFLVSYAVTVIPFLIVNGFLTAIPVVLYNDAENLGIRIFSFLPWPMHNIPVEDIFYGMLLVFMNIVLYEKLKHQSQFPV